MGPKSVAIQAVPAGVVANDAEHLLTEILDGLDRENAAISIDTLQVEDRGFDGVPCGNQGEYATGSDEDGMAADGAGENGLPDELSAWRPVV